MLDCERRNAADLQPKTDQQLLPTSTSSEPKVVKYSLAESWEDSELSVEELTLYINEGTLCSKDVHLDKAFLDSDHLLSMSFNPEQEEMNYDDFWSGWANGPTTHMMYEGGRPMGQLNYVS